MKSFIPSFAQTPGRMNVFQFKNFDFIVDYAHNIDGFLEVKKFMSKTSAAVKIGIIGAPGDRRDEDISKIGEISAQMFDEIIIRHDKDLRGRTAEEISALLIQGIWGVNPNLSVKVISDANAAMQYAIDTAKQGSLVFISTESVYQDVEFIMNAKKVEGNQNENISELFINGNNLLLPVFKQ